MAAAVANTAQADWTFTQGFDEPNTGSYFADNIDGVFFDLVEN